MTRDKFIGMTDKIYKAIRKAYGYGDEGDEIMDAFDEMADAWERENAGANIKIGAKNDN